MQEAKELAAVEIFTLPTNRKQGFLTHTTVASR